MELPALQFMPEYGRKFNFIGLVASLALHAIAIGAAAATYHYYRSEGDEQMLQVLGFAEFGISSAEHSSVELKSSVTNVLPLQEEATAREVSRSVVSIDENNRREKLNTSRPKHPVSKMAKASLAEVEGAKSETTFQDSGPSPEHTNLAGQDLGIEEFVIGENSVARGIRKPTYPILSRRLGEEGRVVLRVEIEKGEVASDVEIESSSGFSRLDQAARQAILSSHFGPQSAPVRRIAFKFELK